MVWFEGFARGFQNHAIDAVEIPLEGKGTDDASNAALATLRGTLLPETLGQVEGVEYAVTGATAASQDYNAAQARSLPLVFTALRAPPGRSPASATRISSW